MERELADEAADAIDTLFEAALSDRPVSTPDLRRFLQVADRLRETEDSGVTHSLEVGDVLIDGREPTPSPEVNTVRVVELTHQRADEFETEEGKVVSEYKHNRFYPNDDPVVAGVYPNMSDDKVWHFPESRLR